VPAVEVVPVSDIVTAVHPVSHEPVTVKPFVAVYVKTFFFYETN
jgi:hypothetical protein